MRLIAKVIRISCAKFHCNRLTTVQDIQHHASLSFFWETLQYRFTVWHGGGIDWQSAQQSSFPRHSSKQENCSNSKKPIKLCGSRLQLVLCLQVIVCCCGYCLQPFFLFLVLETARYSPVVLKVLLSTDILYYIKSVISSSVVCNF